MRKSFTPALFAFLACLSRARARQLEWEHRAVLVLSATSSCAVSSIPAAATYAGLNHTNGTTVRLRIGNGGAGQSGLVGALAQAYIDFSRDDGLAATDYLIDWVLGDTTDTIAHLATGDVDIAITYNAAAEYRAGNTSVSIQRLYGFRDHFYLMGPPENPAGLSPNETTDDAFNRLVTAGNNNSALTVVPTYFLSRFDKSATNIKESLIFAGIGQVPWAYAYSKWYHQYPQFPQQALTAASLLHQYTLTDRGTFLSLNATAPAVAANLVLFKRGEDVDPADQLLNPASVLLGSKVCPLNRALAEGFMTWMAAAGQQVVKNFREAGHEEELYTMAPNCTATPALCAGW